MAPSNAVGKMPQSLKRDPSPAAFAQNTGATPRPSPSVTDNMRAYRACLNCRNRKSKCDLNPNGGRPPCRRCTREIKDCILGESHRGGRRVKKRKVEESDPALSNNSGQSTSFLQISNTTSSDSPIARHRGLIIPPPFQPRSDAQDPGFTWQQPTPTNTVGSDTSPRLTEPAIAGRRPSLLDPTRMNEKVASADLHNPSDALEILAQVADRDSPETEQRKVMTSRHARYNSIIDSFDYKPLQDGMITAEMIYHLFSSYEEFFHGFFPIAPRETFNRTRLPWISRHEPYLFSAILTIASKDNETVHQTCYNHMQQLLLAITAGAEVEIDAVEAVLLLSLWVSHRPQAAISVGRGEEDRVAWMLVGTAVRLGYYLGLDRTAFRNDSNEDPVKYNRKRLVWTACYICDRNVSVRLGKGFWSRGPGPLSGLRSSDFPTLEPTNPNEDNWALVFQANLELTLIFSNVHDILYASKGRGWNEMIEGRYIKFLDDFRTNLRSWHDTWGSLTCSPRIKASLLLTYEYLRLYINAFAYQATTARVLIFRRDHPHINNPSLPSINSSAPDARFIYDALDAAQTLLTTINDCVDPETLRYMPSFYYLFIIYSAVFLYKARSTTTMSDDERTRIRLMVNQTIDRLQKSSVGSNHIGSRYARLLQLLWRRTSKKSGDQNAMRHSAVENGNAIGFSNQNGVGINSGQNFNPSKFIPLGLNDDLHAHTNENPNNGMNPMATGPGTFSWLDLGATWNFATRKNNVSEGGLEINFDSGAESSVDALEALGDEGAKVDVESGVGGGGEWDSSELMMDYRLLEGDNPNLIF